MKERKEEGGRREEGGREGGKEGREGGMGGRDEREGEKGREGEGRGVKGREGGREGKRQGGKRHPHPLSGWEKIAEAVEFVGYPDVVPVLKGGCE